VNNNDGKHMEHEEQTANVAKKAWHKPALSVLQASNTMSGGVMGFNETETPYPQVPAAMGTQTVAAS
jgi:hypothetical protein